MIFENNIALVNIWNKNILYTRLLFDMIYSVVFYIRYPINNHWSSGLNQAQSVIDKLYHAFFYVAPYVYLCFIIAY
jgi:hypothetical protein